MAAALPPARPDWRRCLKDATFAAVIALLLAIPMIGFVAIDEPQGLRIATRFDWVAVCVVAVFIGRLLLGVLRQARPQRMSIFSADIATRLRPLSSWFVWLGLGFAVALPFLPFASRYSVDLATTV